MAEIKRLDLGNLNTTYERELKKPDVHQMKGRWNLSPAKFHWVFSHSCAFGGFFVLGVSAARSVAERGTEGPVGLNTSTVESADTLIQNRQVEIVAGLY